MAIFGLPTIKRKEPAQSGESRSPKPVSKSSSRFKAPERDVNRMIDEIPGLKSHQREIIKAKLDIGQPGRETHLTRDEFRRLVREMEENPHDLVLREHAKKLRAKENELFEG